MFLACAFLGGLTSYFISAIFNRLIYFPVAFFALIILNIEILSLFKSIKDTNILILSVIFTVITSIFWFRKNKPVINIFPRIKNFMLEIKSMLKSDGTLFLPVVAWIFFIFTAFILSSLVPPVEPDAQSYHALRVLFWLKDGFISRFETADERMLCMPYNSEIFYTWLMCLTKKDTAFGLLQFFSYFLLIGSSYKIMELLKIDFIKRIWAILIFSSFPAIIIQTSSSQTDLCLASLFAFSFYLVLSYKNKPENHLLYFASLASGIAFGVKTSAFFMVAPLFIWFIFILKKDFIKFFLFFMINFLVFSSYSYILNYISCENFLSTGAFITYNKFNGGIKAACANFIKYIIQFIDFSGLALGKFLNPYILSFRDNLFNFLSIPIDIGEIDPLERVNYTMDEQIGAFGILGFLVFLPCSIIALFNKKLKGYAVTFWVSLILLCSLMIYTVYGIRYVTAFVAFSFPVLSLSYFKKNNILKIIFILYAVYYMGYASLFSPMRPLGELFFTYLKKPDIAAIQNRMRNLEFRFLNPVLYEEAAAHRYAVEPYCKDGNKIAVFAPYTLMLYSTKYLETKNNCSIDTPNILHSNSLDFNRYKAIITANDNYQHTNVITKKDIENPFVKSKKAMCYYSVPNKTAKKDATVKDAISASCSLKIDYLESLGFKKVQTYKYHSNNISNFKIKNLEVYSK